MAACPFCPCELVLLCNFENARSKASPWCGPTATVHLTPSSKRRGLESPFTKGVMVPFVHVFSFCGHEQMLIQETFCSAKPSEHGIVFLNDFSSCRQSFCHQSNGQYWPMNSSCDKAPSSRYQHDLWSWQLKFVPLQKTEIATKWYYSRMQIRVV